MKTDHYIRRNTSIIKPYLDRVFDTDVQNTKSRDDLTALLLRSIPSHAKKAYVKLLSCGESLSHEYRQLLYWNECQEWWASKPDRKWDEVVDHAAKVCIRERKELNAWIKEEGSKEPGMRSVTNDN